MQHKEFRSLAVLLYLYFTAFFTYSTLIQYRKYYQTAIIRNTTEIPCNSWTRDVHYLSFPRTPPLFSISRPHPVQQPLVGQGLLIIEASPSHSDPPVSERLLWTSDGPDVEDSTWQHTTLTRDRHPCCRIDSNLQSHPVSGRRPTPWTARTGHYIGPNNSSTNLQRIISKSL